MDHLDSFCMRHWVPSRCAAPPLVREEEATILTLEDFAQAVLDVHHGMSDTTHGALDLATVTGTMRDTLAGQKLLKELGLTGKYYLKTVNGKTYVVLRGYAGLRSVLTGTRYTSLNPKMISFGLGPEALKAGLKTNLIIMIACYIPLEVTEFILSDDKIYAELFADLITDVAIGTVSLAAGALAAYVLSGGLIASIAFPAAFVVGGAIFVGIGASFLLNESGASEAIRNGLSEALTKTSEAMAAGIQGTGVVIVNAHTALKTELERLEDDLDRGISRVERELIWHFAPGAYPYLYRH